MGLILVKKKKNYFLFKYKAKHLNISGPTDHKWVGEIENAFQTKAHISGAVASHI